MSNLTLQICRDSANLVAVNCLVCVCVCVYVCVAKLKVVVCCLATKFWKQIAIQQKGGGVSKVGQ